MKLSPNVAFAVFVVLLVVLPSACHPEEPAYEDRTLTEWIKDLSDDDWSVRARAAEVLGSMGRDAAPAVPALARTLEDEGPFVRTYAAQALGQIGPAAKAALPALQKALDGGSGVVRTYAEIAIERIKQGLGVPDTGTGPLADLSGDDVRGILQQRREEFVSDRSGPGKQAFWWADAGEWTTDEHGRTAYVCIVLAAVVPADDEAAQVQLLAASLVVYRDEATGQIEARRHKSNGERGWDVSRISVREALDLFADKRDLSPVPPHSHTQPLLPTPGETGRAAPGSAPGPERPEDTGPAEATDLTREPVGPPGSQERDVLGSVEVETAPTGTGRPSSEEALEKLEFFTRGGLSLGLVDEQGQQLVPGVPTDAPSLTTEDLRHHAELIANGASRTIGDVVEFLGVLGVVVDATGEPPTADDLLPAMQRYVEWSFAHRDDPRSRLGLLLCGGPDLNVPEAPPTLTGDTAIVPLAATLLLADVALGAGEREGAHSTLPKAEGDAPLLAFIGSPSLLLQPRADSGGFRTGALKLAKGVIDYIQLCIRADSKRGFPVDLRQGEDLIRRLTWAKAALLAMEVQNRFFTVVNVDVFDNAIRDNLPVGPRVHCICFRGHTRNYRMGVTGPTRRVWRRAFRPWTSGRREEDQGGVPPRYADELPLVLSASVYVRPPGQTPKLVESQFRYTICLTSMNDPSGLGGPLHEDADAELLTHSFQRLKTPHCYIKANFEFWPVAYRQKVYFPVGEALARPYGLRRSGPELVFAVHPTKLDNTERRVAALRTQADAGEFNLDFLRQDWLGSFYSRWRFTDTEWTVAKAVFESRFASVFRPTPFGCTVLLEGRPLPDLVVTEASAVIHKREGAGVELVRGKATVRNQGEAETRAQLHFTAEPQPIALRTWWLEATKVDPTALTTLSTSVVLAPGQTHDFALRPGAILQGELRSGTVYVDPDDKIPELNEQNNLRQITITDDVRQPEPEEPAVVEEPKEKKEQPTETPKKPPLQKFDPPLYLVHICGSGDRANPKPQDFWWLVPERPKDNVVLISGDGGNWVCYEDRCSGPYDSNHQLGQALAGMGVPYVSCYGIYVSGDPNVWGK